MSPKYYNEEEDRPQQDWGILSPDLSTFMPITPK